jgi:hypothetical protein
MVPIGCLIIFSLWFVKIWNNIERRWDIKWLNVNFRKK